MTTTKAQKANSTSASTNAVIPQAIAEAMNIAYGDRLSWTLENRGDPQTPYLVAVITNESNRDTSTRKLLDGIRITNHAFQEAKAYGEKEHEYAEALKEAWENSQKLVDGLEKELSLYKQAGKENAESSS